MRRLLVPLVILLATFVAAPSAIALPAPENYEQIINDPSLTREHSTVIRLYQAVFGRQPEAEGLRFWLDSFDSGEWSTRRIANFFVTSSEFVETYGETDNTAFMIAVYTNVLGRTPDADGATFWVGELEAGMDRAEMVLLIANAPEFIAENPLPSDAPDFTTLTRGTLTVTHTFEVDGELLTSNFVIAFDLDAAQPITHQWIDTGDVVAAYGEREGPLLAAEQAECVANISDDEDGNHGQCDRQLGFGFLGAHLQPSEAFTVGTFTQVRANEALGVLTTASDHNNAIDGFYTMIERYWPGFDPSETHVPAQLIDEADAGRWASIEPHSFVIGWTFDHSDVSNILSETEVAAVESGAHSSSGESVWTVDNVPGLPFSSFGDVDGWTNVTSTVTITENLEPGVLDIPSPLLTRDEMLDLFVTPTN